MQRIHLYHLLVILFCFFPKTSEFVPNNALNVILNLLDLELPTGSFTHRKISEDAIVQVARDVLLDNPNPTSGIDSSGGINSIGTLTAANLITAYFGTSSRDFADNFENAIEEINDANENVDLNDEDKKSAPAHFDSERIQEGQNLLVKLRHMIIMSIGKGEYSVARTHTGRFLHTLQDFYSHSNWVEMGNSEPYSVLGKPDQNPDNIVSATRLTCVDCERDGLVLFLLGLTGAKYYYKCQDNIRADVNNDRKLTSGYYSGQVDMEKRELLKPEGKCSHGGFFDPSSDEIATGGINKDSKSPSYSPHGDLHVQAASLATTASVAILADLRKQIHDDTKFSAFLNINLRKQTVASIAYVIDTTGSMGEELPEIQATIPMIRKMLEDYIDSLGPNAEVNFILVPFNDPDPGQVIETSDIDVFLSAIGSLSPNGGGDCPEPSLGATIRAIRASEANSPIFVYTDASASDSGRLTELQALVRKTGVRIFYVVTGSCGSRRRRSTNDQSNVNTIRSRRQLASEDIYSFIAAYSGGQVLNVAASSISNLSSIIFQSTESSYTQILFRTGTNTASELITFPVDETISSIIVTLNGNSIEYNLTTPGGGDLFSLNPATDYSVELNTQFSFIVNVNISNNTFYGVWILNFTSTGSYSVQISAISSLRFLYQFYQLDPQSHLGFSNIEGNPTLGQTLILLITTSVEDERVNFTSVNLINAVGVAVQFLNLTKTDTNSFGSLFIPTLQVFHLEIIGVDSMGNPVKRVSGTGVQVSDVNLRLGEGSSHYNSLYPGNSSNITLLLSNFGDNSTFLINIAHDNTSSNFYYNSSHTELTVNTNATAEIVLIVTASNNATDGDAINFIVTATTYAGSNQRNNFVTFLFIVSTLPPPIQTENILSAAVKETVDALLLLLLLLANAFLFLL